MAVPSYDPFYLVEGTFPSILPRRSHSPKRSTSHNTHTPPPESKRSSRGTHNVRTNRCAGQPQLRLHVSRRPSSSSSNRKAKYIEGVVAWRLGGKCSGRTSERRSGATVSPHSSQLTSIGCAQRCGMDEGMWDCGGGTKVSSVCGSNSVSWPYRSQLS
jgi:hypothetical protein